MLTQNFNLIHLASVRSTNLHATDLLSGKKLIEPTVILADYQTEGKGQGENTWLSDDSKNLLFSLVVFPNKIKAREQFYISKISAIAVREMLSEHIAGAKIKWPNDILVNKLKIGGILIQNTLRADLISNTVIGIGLNVNQEKFSLPAVSMKTLTGKEFDRIGLLNSFLGIFMYWFETLQNRDFATIELEYLKYLYGFQQWLKFSWGGVEFEAFVEGVESDGYLILKTRDGKILKFGFREVDFLLDA